MKPLFFAALALSCAAIAAPAAAPQQGVLVSREQAQALFEQIKGPCATGPVNGNKACAVLVYSPEDCTKEKDPHVRKIFNTYDDGTVRFENGSQVGRNRPGALLTGVGIFNKKGETTRYIAPQFLSWDEYQAGKRSMPVCGKDARISVKDFEIASPVQKFLKANP